MTAADVPPCSPNICKRSPAAVAANWRLALSDNHSYYEAMDSGQNVGHRCCDSPVDDRISRDEPTRVQVTPVTHDTPSSFSAASGSQTRLPAAGREGADWERGKKSCPTTGGQTDADRPGGYMAESGTRVGEDESSTTPTVGGEDAAGIAGVVTSVPRREQNTPEEPQGSCCCSTSKLETEKDVQGEQQQRLSGLWGLGDRRLTSLRGLRATQSDCEDDPSSAERRGRSRGLRNRVECRHASLPCRLFPEQNDTGHAHRCPASPAARPLQHALSSTLRTISPGTDPIGAWRENLKLSTRSPPVHRHTVGGESLSCRGKSASHASYECVGGRCLLLRHCWSCRSEMSETSTNTSAVRGHDTLCRSCRQRKELARWKQMTDWRASVEGIQFLSLQKHYKYWLPNQLDSAAFSVHNKIEKRLFFVVTHTSEPRASHLPAGWHMSLYLPNPSIQHDVLNVTDPKSTEAFTVIRADRPCGSSLLSYVSRPAVTVRELVHCRDSRTTKKNVLGHITVSRSPFMTLRVRDAQSRKIFDLVRHRKGNKERRAPQEWVAYGSGKGRAMAEVTLFLDECKSIAGRDATIMYAEETKSTTKMLALVCLCYIQFLSFGRCGGAEI